LYAVIPFNLHRDNLAYMQMPDNWIELSLLTTPELAEAISDALHEHVEGGVVLEQLNDRTGLADRWEDEVATGPVIVRGYFADDASAAQRKEQIEFALRCLNMVVTEQGGEPIPQATYKTMQRTDWGEKWKESYKPIRIGGRVVLRPSWIDAKTSDAQVQLQPNDVEIVLDPGQAFGTGLHPTTQLCAMALEQTIQPQLNQRVFDIGSGSAILTILAIKLGAPYALGVDNDEDAVRVGAENAQINAVQDRVEIAFGSWDSAPEQHFDIVVANILAPVIIKMLDGGMAKRGNQFIFSGILDTQADDVIAAMQRNGLRLLERKQMLDWVALLGAVN
jgi:ribosomal protein L11 methyltransferase